MHRSTKLIKLSFLLKQTFDNDRSRYLTIKVRDFQSAMDLQPIAFFLFGFSFSCFLVQNFLLDVLFDQKWQRRMRKIQRVPKRCPEVNASMFYNASLANDLFNDVKVLCWVMTHPKNHKKRSRHIKSTWGKRCNTLLFISTVYDPKLPTIKLNYPDGREFLWYKTRDAFQYVYDNHFGDADWFMRTDDDKFV